MTIEVRQMLIKSTVLPEGDERSDGGDNTSDVDEIISRVLEECRQMVIDMLRRERER